MARPHRMRSAWLCAMLTAGAGAAVPAPENIVTTATREPVDALVVPGNVRVLDAYELELTDAQHAFELGSRIPGTWLSRGSGQENLTAIRSPILTGPGSCGAFLILEDGIPTRPAGFCNVNQFFEVPLELASGVEVLRGPANAYYGSNGLHGTVNVLLPRPGVNPGVSAQLEAGAQSFRRARVRWSADGGRAARSAGVLLDDDGGYRRDSGYEQFKGFYKESREFETGTLDLSFTATELDQETAGFITGLDAYKDKSRRFDNENPEAFRDAGSRRFALTWLPSGTAAWQPEYRAWLRNSDMEFLQHFLPGQPLEKNGQTSGGVAASSRGPFASGRLAIGVDAELARIDLEETQDGPTMGSPFLMETRPAGKHYDYVVDSLQLAAYADWRRPFGDRWTVQAGARAEYTRYDYDNRMIPGNTRDDGSECGFGGCLYSRPADRSDDFFDFAPTLGVLYALNDRTRLFANVSRGFRAPQTTELYRLQSGQTVADIRSERLDAVEVGVRHRAPRFSLESAVYLMRKKNFIFRDAEGFNVSDGRTRHAGIELEANWQLTEALYLAATGSYSEQEYRFDRDAGLGETIRRGNTIDTAPRVLASIRAGYARARTRAELEWTHTDSYYLDSANTARYPGHQLWNLRIEQELSPRWQVGLRILNLRDEVYADRADLLAATDPVTFRYFPGHPREAYVSVTWRSD